MIHVVTKDLDKGPPLTFCTFPLRDPLIDPLWETSEKKLKDKSLPQVIQEEGEHNELFKEIRKRGSARELPLIVETLKTLSSGTIRIQDKQIVINDTVQHQPYCLTEQIEAVIKYQLQSD